MSTLFLLLAITSVVYFDAGYLRSRDSSYYARSVKMSPGAWAVLVFLLSGLTGPWYLLRRQRLLRQLSTGDPLMPPTERFALRTELAGVFLLWILLSIWLGFLIGLATGAFAALTGRPVDALATTTVTALLVNLVFVVVLAAQFREPPRRAFWSTLGWSGPVRWWKWVAGPMLLGLAMAFAVGGVAVLVGDEARTPLSGMLESASAFGLAVFTLAAILTAPFFEELVFRGYLYPALERLRGAVTATAMVTLLFALVHLGQLWGAWITLLAILVVGLVLTLLRALSGSTIPSTVAHLSYNAALLAVVPVVFLYLQSPALFELLGQGDDLPPARQEELMLQVLDEAPDNSMVLNNLASLWAQEGRNLDRALELVDRAIEIAPEEPAYLDTRAQVHFAKGEIAPAIAVEQWLVGKHPDDGFYRTQLERFQRALAERESTTAESVSSLPEEADAPPALARRASIELQSWDPSSTESIGIGDYVSLRVAYTTDGVPPARLQADIQLTLTVGDRELTVSSRPRQLTSASGELTLWTGLGAAFDQAPAGSRVEARGRLLLVDDSPAVLAETEAASWELRGY